MIDSFKAIWSFITANSVVVGILTIVITISLWYLNWRREQRRITYRIESNKFISLDGARSIKGLEVKLDGEEIRELWSHLIEIHNDGRRDLSEGDLSGDISIKSISSVYGPVLQEEVPGLALSSEGNEIQLKLGLFKRRERITISFLSQRKDPPTVQIRAREFEIREFQVQKGFFRKLFVDNAPQLFTFTVFVALYFLGRIASTQTEPTMVLPDEDHTPIKRMRAIRSVASFIVSRALVSTPAVLPKFDSNEIPPWADSGLSIEAWGGRSEVLGALDTLRIGGIRVRTPADSVGTKLSDLRKEDVILEIISRTSEFPYRELTESGVFR